MKLFKLFVTCQTIMNVSKKQRSAKWKLLRKIQLWLRRRIYSKKTNQSTHQRSSWKHLHQQCLAQGCLIIFEIPVKSSLLLHNCFTVSYYTYDWVQILEKKIYIYRNIYIQGVQWYVLQKNYIDF